MSPWLPVSDSFPESNVEAERRHPLSFLSLHKRLTGLRRTHPALARGACLPVPASGDLLTYVRREGEEALFVALNLGGDPDVLVLRNDWGDARLGLSPHMDRENELLAGDIALRADEGVILERGTS